MATAANKIQNAVVDTDGMVFRHLVVTLKEGDNIATFREDPTRWTTVQAAPHTRLKKGDRVTLISFDGSVIHDQYDVSKIEAGSVWLSDKPLRVIALHDDSALFSDGTNEVVAKGVGYAVRNIRSRRDDGPIYTTAKAAEAEILWRQTRTA